MIVAAAYVRVDNQVGGFALDNSIVQGHAQLAYLLDVHCLHTRFGHEVGVAVNAPGAVVELDVTATCSIQVGDYLAICRRNGIEQLSIGCVRTAQAFLPAVASIERYLGKRLDRSRNGLAGNMAFAGKRLRKLEVIHKRVVLARDGTHNHCGIGRGFLVVEHIAFAAGTTLDALQAPHEVKMRTFISCSRS